MTCGFGRLGADDPVGAELHLPAGDLRATCGPCGAAASRRPCSRRNARDLRGVALELVEVEQQRRGVDLVLVAPDDRFLLRRQERHRWPRERLHERLRERRRGGPSVGGTGCSHEVTSATLGHRPSSLVQSRDAADGRSTGSGDGPNACRAGARPPCRTAPARPDHRAGRRSRHRGGVPSCELLPPSPRS